MLNQKTLAQTIILQGVGLHSGRECQIRLDPAPENNGVSFQVPNDKGDLAIIDANWQNIINTVLCTELQGPSGAKIRTIEHLMSAIRACNIDNVDVVCSANEVPILDGSSLPFVRAIEKSGVQVQRAPRRILKIRKPVRVEMDGKWAEYTPFEGCRYEMEIDFVNPAIGQQLMAYDLSFESFVEKIAPARTFGELDQASGLLAAGLALGASPSNTLIFDQSAVVSHEGKRFDDECVRHKILDAIGDLHLVGGAILGHFKGYKSGHKLHSILLKEVMTTIGAASWVNSDARVISDSHPKPATAYVETGMVDHGSASPAASQQKQPSTIQSVPLFSGPGIAEA